MTPRAKDVEAMSPQPIEPSGVIDAPEIARIDVSDIAVDRYTEFLVASNERAVPDVRDGLKPVHRRILQSFRDNGATATSRHFKSAKIAGDTMGRYHPHGDMAIYDAAVSMAQDFSLRYPLIDFQGNVGSIDGDPAAASRYTEMRTSFVGDEMLRDLENRAAGIINWGGNYTNEYDEAYVLPGRFPQLLANGILAGIGTGYSAMWLPHNAREIIDAVIAVIDNPKLTAAKLGTIITGPDFPTGGELIGLEGFHAALETGKGSVVLRGTIAVEEAGKETRLIITSIPWQTEKSALVEQIIACTVKDKHGRAKIEGIADVSDESGQSWRTDMRVVITLKKDAVPAVVARLLYRETSLQKSFSYNQMAYTEGYPELLSTKSAIEHYIAHQMDVLTRRTQYRKRKAEEALEVQEAYLLADKWANQLVPLAKKSGNRSELEAAIPKLIKGATKRQCEVIAGMPLYRFSKIDTASVKTRITELKAEIAEYTRLLGSKSAMSELLKAELREIRQKHGDDRRTKIVEAGEIEVKNIDELLPDEPCWITLSASGLVSRLAANAIKTGKRGAAGGAAPTKSDDPAVQVIAARTRDRLWMLTSRGNLFGCRASEIDEVARGARGTNVRRFLSLAEGETPVRLVVPPTTGQEGELVIATANGKVLRTRLGDYANLNAAGLRAINLIGDDRIVSAAVAVPGGDLIGVSSDGFSARFALDEVSVQGRGAQGVTSMRLGTGAHIVSLLPIAAKDSRDLAVVVATGKGKRTKLSEYQQKGRGIRGVTTIAVPKGSSVAFAAPVGDEDIATFVLSDGKVVTMAGAEIKRQGRATAGVIVVAPPKGGSLVAGAAITARVEEPKR